MTDDTEIQLARRLVPVAVAPRMNAITKEGHIFESLIRGHRNADSGHEGGYGDLAK